ncbi:hypothetical protein OOK29_42445 [Streptomyces phaeochromogenes]|uniref:hypothetical protein n=1 Tax=Streptomyces TaxID=1883 RepID=UPI002252C65A|nr:hypothetical protein [Streptomyces phaeochromogenes]MCX5604808.1 hypothetical protein [Streptomyces phaeochromogenes]
MGGFAEAVLERARGARDGLEAAHLAQGAFAVTGAADGLDDVLRLARGHGLGVEVAGTDARGAG